MGSNYLVKVGYQVDSKPLDNMNVAAEKNAEALNRAAASTQKYTMSQKQLAAATRGVPAQLTDIAVSLQGGQNPMTVFLQQGGQLKDMFGGIRPAVSALSASLLGLINPLTIGAGAAAAMTYAWYSGQKELAKFNAALILTGNYARLTTDDFSNMRSAIASFSGDSITMASAAAALAEVAGTGKIAGENIQTVARAAEQMRDATGKAVSETVAEFVRLSEDPLAALVKLNETQHFLTSETYEAVKALMEQGKTVDAVTMASNAYADSINNNTGKIVENLGYMEAGWRGIKNIILEAVDGWRLLGRETPNVDKFAGEYAKLIDLQKQLKQERATPSIIDMGQAASIEKEIAATRKRIAALQSANVAETKANTAKANTAKIDGYLIQSSEDYTRHFMSNAQKRNQAIAAETNTYKGLLSAARGNASEIEQVEAAHQRNLQTIAKRYADPKAPKGPKPPKSAEQKEAEQQARALERALKSVNEAAAKAIADGDLDKMMQLIRGDAISTTLPDRLTAINNAMSRFGIEITSAVTNSQGMLDLTYRMSEAKAKELGLWDEATNSINTASAAYQDYMIKVGELGKTTEGNTVNDQAAKAKEDAARVRRDIEAEIEQINARTEIMRGATFTNEEAITRQLEEQAYWADIERQIAEGTLVLKEGELELLKQKRREAEAGNKAEQKNMDLMKDAYDKFKNTLKSSISDALQTGKFDFKKFLGDIANMLIQSGIDKIFANLFKTDGSTGQGGSTGGGIWGTVLSAIGSFFGAKSSKGTETFATGAVFNSPTSFGMAGSKRGIKGEAVPEAIMPLARGPGGKLGVVASGGGGGNTTILTIAPGAVIVQSTGNANADTAATAKAIDQMMEIKFKKMLADQHRPGNPMNRSYRA